LKDIEVASLNIDQLLQMQTMAVDSLTEDVSLIKSRLHGMKSQQLLSSLEEMKATSTVPANAMQKEERVSVRTVKVDYPIVQAAKKPRGNNEHADALSEMEASLGEESTAVQAPQPQRRRIPIEERYGCTPRCKKCIFYPLLLCVTPGWPC
jgi:predicted HAD superfamily phosphohydrolase YqeG